MYWGIYSEECVQHLKLKGERPILIRALEPSYKGSKIPYEIQNINEYVDVLELYFDDITSKRDDEKFVLFDEDMGCKLIHFINRNKFDEIVVHCSMGVSRSSALMICISRILNLPQIEEDIIKSGRFCPNKLVLEEFSECTMINIKRLDNEVTKELINRNEELWQDEICDIIIDEDEYGVYSLKFEYKK